MGPVWRVHADSDEIDKLLRACQDNIIEDLDYGQDRCREGLARIDMADFPGKFRRQKTEFFQTLAESYLRSGRIQESRTRADSALRYTDEESVVAEIKNHQKYIDRSYQTLRITIKDRWVPLLSYIKEMDLDFAYPKRRLEEDQILRIINLTDERVRRIDELQFAGFDSAGQAYMEIKNFPVVRTSAGGESPSYSLIVERERRYRFYFTDKTKEPVEIFWENDAGWKLVERVPDGMVKLEMPAKYKIKVQPSEQTQIQKRAGEKEQHVYVAALPDTMVAVSIEESDDRRWEKFYDTATYVVAGAAAFTALLGAR